MLLLLRTAVLTGTATAGIAFGVSGTSALCASATLNEALGLTGSPAQLGQGSVALSFGLSDTPPVTGSATVALNLDVTAQAVVSGQIAGPTDGRIADTAFRRKKKRKLEEIARPSQPVDPIRVGAVGAIPQPAKTYDFRSLAELSGTSVEAFRAEVDREIAELMQKIQEQDDEEALTLILTALED